MAGSQARAIMNTDRLQDGEVSVDYGGVVGYRDLVDSLILVGRTHHGAIGMSDGRKCVKMSGIIYRNSGGIGRKWDPLIRFSEFYFFNFCSFSTHRMWLVGDTMLVVVRGHMPPCSAHPTPGPFSII